MENVELVRDPYTLANKKTTVISSGLFWLDRRIVYEPGFLETFLIQRRFYHHSLSLTSATSQSSCSMFCMLQLCSLHGHLCLWRSHDNSLSMTRITMSFSHIDRLMALPSRNAISASTPVIYYLPIVPG